MAVLQVEKITNSGTPPSFSAPDSDSETVVSLGTLTYGPIAPGSATLQVALPVTLYDSLRLENFSNNLVSSSVTRTGVVSLSWTSITEQQGGLVTFTLVATRGVETASVKYSFILQTPIGQQAYTTPGTFSFVAPQDVTSVSVVAVGAGGRGGSSWSSGGNGGGGLGWKSSIPVTPGQSYTVQVGATGSSSGNSGDSTTYGQNSFFISLDTVSGYGGGQGGPGSQGTGSGHGGGFVGDGGGRGGKGGGGSWTEGGGGAGGYAGAGGTAGNTSGGAQGGAGNGAYSQYSSTWGTGGGGGVGILGQGATASGWNPAVVGGAGGNGGSGGTAGTWGETASYGQGSKLGGQFGGGGGGSGTNTPGGAGGSGAVRIVWGYGRQYPIAVSVQNV